MPKYLGLVFGMPQNCQARTSDSSFKTLTDVRLRVQKSEGCGSFKHTESSHLCSVSGGTLDSQCTQVFVLDTCGHHVSLGVSASATVSRFRRWCQPWGLSARPRSVALLVLSVRFLLNYFSVSGINIFCFQQQELTLRIKVKTRIF
jgi:hypothetical protein